jgi:putative nucleotidyltransferase with HDIG domain
VNRDTFLAGSLELPPLPEVARRVTAAIRSGNTNATEVATLLSSDAGLVAQLLKIVNSVYYGLPAPIADVRHAVAYLGLSEVERSVLSAALLRIAAPSGSEELRSFWYHSFHTALVAKLLARSHFKPVDSDVQTAALLHDIGKLVYLELFPDHLAAMARHCHESGSSFRDAERHFDLPAHELFGSILCERCRLPEAVRRATELHEIADLTPGVSDEIRLVAVANALANLAAAELAPDRKTILHGGIVAQLELDERGFLLVMGEVYALRTAVDTFLHEL